MFNNGMRPVHPGEILREEYLHPLDMTPTALARLLNVSAPTVNEIVRERRSVTADVALRLAACFNTSPQYWANLQAAFDLRKADIDHGADIAREVQRAPECA